MSKLNNNNWVFNRKSEIFAQDRDKIARYKEYEKRLVPLKIDARTTILVPKEKCTQEYARKWEEANKKRVINAW